MKQKTKKLISLILAFILFTVGSLHNVVQEDDPISKLKSASGQAINLSGGESLSASFVNIITWLTIVFVILFLLSICVSYLES